jgi:formate dehydrogenase subunit beta
MERAIESRMTMTQFLSALFDRLDIAAVAAMSRLPSGRKATFSLITDCADVQACVPFFPAMPANAARLISRFTREAAPSKPVAVFLRPCELRALIELVKINQASMENLLIISWTCPGVFPFQSIDLCDETTLNAYWEASATGKNCEGIRPVCAGCTHFVPKGADLALSLVGRKWDQPLAISFLSEKGRSAAERLGLDFSKTLDAPAAESSMARQRQQGEEALKAETGASLADIMGLVNVFDRCISCHACSYACPICYCKNCYFDSQTFEYFPESYFTRMKAKGALRLPVDRLLFHLGRLSHMGTSCVACGMCEDVCPVNIPVSRIFKTVGSRVQDLFAYTPGEDPDAPMPLAAYAEKELENFAD